MDISVVMEMLVLFFVVAVAVTMIVSMVMSMVMFVFVSVVMVDGLVHSVGMLDLLHFERHVDYHLLVLPVDRRVHDMLVDRDRRT